MKSEDLSSIPGLTEQKERTNSQVVLLWDVLSVRCEYVFLSLVNNKNCLINSQAGQGYVNNQTEDLNDEGLG